jgi:hypothetical protein
LIVDGLSSYVRNVRIGRPKVMSFQSNQEWLETDGWMVLPQGLLLEFAPGGITHCSWWRRALQAAGSPTESDAGVNLKEGAQAAARLDLML